MPSAMEGIFISTLMAAYNKNLHRFALFTSFCTVFLLLAGGMVTSTGSGLAVPDWPLSYGQLMPPMIGGIFYEHGHRMIASFVGFLTVILTFWILRAEKRKWVRMVAVAALASVIIQGLLGGLTVVLMLPTEVSASHGTLAQIYFCIVSALTLFTSRWWLSKEDGSTRIESNSLPSLKSAILMTGVIFVQLILGTIVRHTHSALAIPDFPLAYGQVLPTLSEESMAAYNEGLIRQNVRLFADGPVTRGQITVHLMHRFWALVVLSLVLLNSIRFWKSRRNDTHFVLLAGAFWFVGVGQLVLGALVVLTRRMPDIATAHQTLGAILLMLSVVATLHVFRLTTLDSSSRSLALKPEMA